MLRLLRLLIEGFEAFHLFLRKKKHRRKVWKQVLPILIVGRSEFGKRDWLWKAVDGSKCSTDCSRCNAADAEYLNQCDDDDFDIGLAPG